MYLCQIYLSPEHNMFEGKGLFVSQSLSQLLAQSECLVHFIYWKGFKQIIFYFS